MKRVMWSVLFPFILGLFFLFAGCQSMSREKNEAGAVFSYDSHALSIADMNEDYNAMWRIIEDNYPYMGVAERTAKKDFKKVKEEYGKKIIEGKSDKEFGDLIKSCLNEFEGCGHMRMLDSNEAYAEYLEGYKEMGKTSSHCQAIYSTLNNHASRTFYSYEENAKESIGENRKNPSAHPVRFTTKVFEDISTAYIKIPSFAYDHLEEGLPALQKYFQGISGYKNCIIDIRGNGGGSDTFWINGIVEPNQKKDCTSTYYMLVKGPESEKYVKSDVPLFPIDRLDVYGMSGLKVGDLAEMDHYCKIAQPWKASDNPTFPGDFYILTDQKNYSSAESFVIFCKSTGFATLVGERTGGDGMGIDPMVSTLPKSGICFRFSVLYGLNPDGGSNEECGTAPDISCKGEDALDACLKYLAEKKS